MTSFTINGRRVTTAVEDDTPLLWVIRDERASYGALATFLNARMSNEEIGKEIGLPKSTVQAMGAGRVPERFKPDQRARFHALLDFAEAQIQTARGLLGK